MMDVWKYFQFIVKKNLFLRRKQLSSNDEYGFFQPYKHIQYSVTVIYITILNLPRAIRSKQENTIKKVKLTKVSLKTLEVNLVVFHFAETVLL